MLHQSQSKRLAFSFAPAQLLPAACAIYEVNRLLIRSAPPNRFFRSGFSFILAQSAPMHPLCFSDA